jgi:hypothetical protein
LLGHSDVDGFCFDRMSLAPVDVGHSRGVDDCGGLHFFEDLPKSPIIVQIEFELCQAQWTDVNSQTRERENVPVVRGLLHNASSNKASIASD